MDDKQVGQTWKRGGRERLNDSTVQTAGWTDTVKEARQGRPQKDDDSDSASAVVELAESAQP